jgi:hypothetical protein
MLYYNLIKLAEDIKSIAFFSEKANISNDSQLKNSLRLKISDLQTKAATLYDLIKENENKLITFEKLLTSPFEYKDDKYLAGSKISAINKGHEVLRQLSLLNTDLTNYGFVSLGGGDGTELYTEIDNSKVNYGLLLEYDFDSVNKFVQNIIPFTLKNYSRLSLDLDVIECDLFDKTKLTTAKKLIESKNLNGIIITIHAVLHELSTRSQLKSKFIDENGDILLEEFFRELYEWHENIIIIVREPGIAENWPEWINIRISDVHRENFLSILDDLDRSHFGGNLDPNFEYREKQKIIRCRSDLAIDSLTKLFYNVDYLYERREKITSISRKKIVTSLQAGEELYQIHKTDAFFTNSVELNMDRFEVHVTGENNYPQGLPQCFTYTIALKGTHKKLS